MTKASLYYDKDGNEWTIAKLMKKTGLSKAAIQARLNKGWSVEKTISTKRYEINCLYRPKPGINVRVRRAAEEPTPGERNELAVEFKPGISVKTVMARRWV